MPIRAVRALLFSLSAALPGLAAATTVEIVPGEGFEEPTPRAPIDGNPGETVGEQRLFAARYAANLLATKIDSDVPIRIRVDFRVEDCGPGSAVTGMGGPLASFINFENAPDANVFYPVALANALSGQDLAPPGSDGPEADIGVEFNSRIDNNAACAFGPDYYYGYANNPRGSDIDFVATAMHEFIHGLGFISNVILETGRFAGDIPFIYDTRIQDLDYNGRFWPQLTVNERDASIQGGASVVLGGEQTTSQGADTLTAGTTDSKVRLHAPVDGPVTGSSISHWSDQLSPNALMEPSDTGDIAVNDGLGLATCLLADIGWALGNGIHCPDRQQVDPAEIAPDAGPAEPTNGTNDGSDASGTGNDSGGGSNSGGEGGGGCALTGDQTRVDPLAPLLVLAAALGLWRRRLRPA